MAAVAWALEEWNDAVFSIGTIRDGVVAVATGEDAGFEGRGMPAVFCLGVTPRTALAFCSLGGMASCADAVFCIGAEGIASTGFLYVSVARRD